MAITTCRCLAGMMLTMIICQLSLYTMYSWGWQVSLYVPCFADIWSWTKAPDKLKFWPDGGTRWKVKESPKPSQSILQGSSISKCHGNRSSPKAQIVNFIIKARWKLRGSPKALGFSFWGTWMSVLQVMAIHPILKCRVTDQLKPSLPSREPCRYDMANEHAIC